MYIDKRLLKEKEACKEQLELFNKLFPNGVELTLEVCLEHYNKFDLNWCVENLLNDTQRKAYEEAEAPLWKAYYEAEAPLWKAYVEAKAPLWKTYDEAKAPLWKTYDEARVPLKKAYEEARAPLWKAYVEAVAPLQKTYEEAEVKAFFNATQM